MKKQLAVIMAALMLAACAETPENVMSSSGSRSEGSGSASQESSEVQEPAAETVAAASLKASDQDAAERIKQMSFDNLKFADTFTVNAADSPELGVFRAEKMTSFRQDADKLAAAFFGSFDSSKAVSSAQPDGTETVTCEQGDYRMILLDSSLCIQCIPLEEKHRSFSNEDDIVQEFEVTDAFAGGKLPFDEGEGQVSALEKLNAGFFAGLAKAGYDYRPFTVSSMTNQYRGGGQEHTVVMIYNAYFRSLPVFNLVYNSIHGEKLELNYSLAETNSVVFDSPERMDMMILAAPYAETEMTEKIDTVISPEHAVELASSELAEYLELTALRLDLVYVPEFEGTGSELDHDNRRVTLRPCWQLAFGLQPMNEHYALIDARTGKVIYYEPR